MRKSVNYYIDGSTAEDLDQLQSMIEGQLTESTDVDGTRTSEVTSYLTLAHTAQPPVYKVWFNSGRNEQGATQQHLEFTPEPDIQRAEIIIPAVPHDLERPISQQHIGRFVSLLVASVQGEIAAAGA